MAPLTHNHRPQLRIPTVIEVNPGIPVIGGYTIEKILACYPELTREQATAAITHPAI